MIMYTEVGHSESLLLLSYINPSKIFEIHLNPVMLVLIE